MNAWNKTIKYLPGANKFRVDFSIDHIDELDSINSNWNHWHICAFIDVSSSEHRIVINDQETSMIAKDGSTTRWSLKLGHHMVQRYTSELLDILRTKVKETFVPYDYWQCMNTWYDKTVDTLYAEMFLAQKKLDNAGKTWNDYRKLLKHEETT